MLNNLENEIKDYLLEENDFMHFMTFEKEYN